MMIVQQIVPSNLMSFAFIFQNMFSVILSFLFPVLIDKPSIGISKCFFILAFLGFVFGFINYFLINESKGLGNEEVVEKYLGRKRGVQQDKERIETY